MRRRNATPVSRHGLLVAAFVAIAMIFGGGGSPSPKAEIIVQLGFVAALLAWVWWAPRGNEEALQPVPHRLALLGSMLLFVPILQLLLLPPQIWQSLPGRELQVASLSLVDGANSWQPLSISPARTLAGLLALMPAVAVMWATAQLPSRDRRFLILSIALLSIAGAVLGALQLASGGASFYLYEMSHRGWLTAFHANRNAAVDVLLIGSLAMSAFFASKATPPALLRRRMPVLLAGQAVLLLAAILTGSRMGVLLILPVLALNAMILKPLGEGRALKLAGRVASFGVILLLALPLILAGNPRLAAVATRFDAAGDARIMLWRDTLQAIDAFFPVGSGVGTFPVAFAPHQSFESLSAAFINRAHNDFLEFFLEAGLLAPVVLLAGGYLLLRQGFSTWSQAASERAPQIFACGTLGVIALHSLVDYPLRNMAIACLAGVAAGMLSPTQPMREANRDADRDR